MAEYQQRPGKAAALKLPPPPGFAQSRILMAPLRRFDADEELEDGLAGVRGSGEGLIDQP